MKLNREFRTKTFVFRFHLVWVLFYAIAILTVGLFAHHLLEEHGDDQLPSGHVELSVSNQQYQPGETVYFTIKNNFPTKIYITNNCPGEPLNVYKWDGAKWTQIHDSADNPDSECYKQSRRVPISAGATITYSFKDWPHLFENPGVYRLVLVIDHYDELPFVDFKVLEKPAIVTKPTIQQRTSPTSTSTSSPTTPGTDNAPTQAPRETEHELEPPDDD